MLAVTLLLGTCGMDTCPESPPRVESRQGHIRARLHGFAMKSSPSARAVSSLQWDPAGVLVVRAGQGGRE